MKRLIVLADDLSGAAETAAKIVAQTAQITQSGTDLIEYSSKIVLLGECAEIPASVVEEAMVLVVDTDNRQRTVNQARERLGAVLEHFQGLGTEIEESKATPVIFLKIDSLLRGNVAGQLELLASSGPVVMTPALPELKRHTLHGVVLCNGVPLDSTDLWKAESAIAPTSIADALYPLSVHGVDLVDVRGDASVLSDILGRAGSAGNIVVCDAQTQEDLNAIARAALSVEGIRLAGSSALGAALGAALWHSPEAVEGVALDARAEISSIASSSGVKRVCIVVGTASSQGQAQVDRLVMAGHPAIVLDPKALLRGEVDSLALRAALKAEVAVVSLDPAIFMPGAASALSKALAEFLSTHLEEHRLVLTGGETARAVLDALGVQEMSPLNEIEHGAILVETDRGGLVVTRPGSFGNEESLLTILNYLRTYAHPDRATMPAGQGIRKHMNTEDLNSLPYVAVTMGDGAGIGPEVVVAAALNPSSMAECRPIVIGDATRLRQAARIIGVDATIVSIEHVSDSVFEPGRINVMDLALLPEDLAWGELSAVAGDAAFHYIRVASELAMAGEVQAICTAPLNKEALHAAGHIYPGHTELLAKLTGIEEVSMMLSTPKIKVIHVTTHIGLVDAVRKINPGLVERTIRRGHDALVRAGIPAPKIGVCAINPHAGEGGLFGQGEEAIKIAPGVRAAQIDGIDVTGPLPADTLFFLAGRGDYDLVVAMYHDQGHGPVKVLGIEAGVNITVGLPVIRTSVDHGTAFDIAGKAIADPRSMVEALHQAAEMATRPALMS